MKAGARAGMADNRGAVPAVDGALCVWRKTVVRRLPGACSAPPALTDGTTHRGRRQSLHGPAFPLLHPDPC